MRVLLFTDHHIPAGGTEKYFFELKNRLKNLPGYTVYSIGFGPHAQIGADYYVLRASQSRITQLFWRLFINPLVYFKLRQRIRAFNPDVIHIHNIRQFTTSVLLAMKRYPIVQTVHDFSSICPLAQNIHQDQQPCMTGMTKQCFWQHQIKYNKVIYLVLAATFYRLRQQLKRAVKTFIAPSPLLADYLQKHAFAHVHAISPFKNERHDFSFAAMQANHFLFAGNLGTHKGVHLLIEEFALACAQNKSLVLSIAGTGPEEAKMRARISELGIDDNVKFLGWTENLEPYYQACTAVIFPSIGLESFGLVTTEAMSYARPVIGINRGTTAWLVDDGDTGLLFDPVQRGDLAEKMLTLASDSALAQQLGENGFKKLHRIMNNDASIQQITTIYATTHH